MKNKKTFWGVGIILLAVIIILDSAGVLAPLESSVGEISMLSLLAGIALVAFAVSKALQGRFERIFIPLSFVFMLFEKNIAASCGRDGENLINNWLLFGCALLLRIGFSMLFPKRKYWHIGVMNVNNENGQNRYKLGGSRFNSSVRYIDASNFSNEYAENNLSSLLIRFDNEENYDGGGELYIQNNLGSAVIELPASWRHSCKIENNLGSVSVDENTAGVDAPTVMIKGENNLGSVVVKLV